MRPDEGILPLFHSSTEILPTSFLELVDQPDIFLVEVDVTVHNHCEAIRAAHNNRETHLSFCPEVLD